MSYDARLLKAREESREAKRRQWRAEQSEKQIQAKLDKAMLRPSPDPRHWDEHQVAWILWAADHIKAKGLEAWGARPRALFPLGFVPVDLAAQDTKEHRNG